MLKILLKIPSQLLAATIRNMPGISLNVCLCAADMGYKLTLISSERHVLLRP